jgi:hypothetical protein
MPWRVSKMGKGKTHSLENRGWVFFVDLFLILSGKR